MTYTFNFYEYTTFFKKYYARIVFFKNNYFFDSNYRIAYFCNSLKII